MDSTDFHRDRQPESEGLARSRTSLSLRPGSPTAEAAASNSVRCGFESHPGHTYFCVTDRRFDLAIGP